MIRRALLSCASHQKVRAKTDKTTSAGRGVLGPDAGYTLKKYVTTCPQSHTRNISTQEKHINTHTHTQAHTHRVAFNCTSDARTLQYTKTINIYTNLERLNNEILAPPTNTVKTNKQGISMYDRSHAKAY